ncbi:hypothetical protein ONS95_009341 [Cadophora gregata]|uniref:uncharacterized protein n=1 Tax=Cadophora gregata TaxID=51156 RepID=UPI0026DB52CC|nr:uncharacterized protein ONS95_009341 [Cadophora gregata]KAK0124375.1 hypothetical protein ONS95_009341 [Cadophora gregata]
MVDDTMEISSDHGHNDEQGDIDLDLDLTGDHGDEDFILEDATSHLDDIEDELHPQTSVTVNDDIMLDDDNESYQMEDAELLEEETEHIIEQESMSFATDGDASYIGMYGQNGDQLLAADTNGLLYDGYDARSDEKLGFDLQQQPGVVLQEEDFQVQDDSHTKSAETVAQNTAGQGSQVSSPSQSLPPTAPTEPRSPPASILEPGPSPPHSTHENIDSAQLHDANNSRFDIASINDTPSLQTVVVVYREVEYALFSASEHDDPDLYFLSDKTIAEKPLSEFFKAIREVIRNDLTDEDELCLVVDSLGLQVEEVGLINNNSNDVKLTQLEQVSSFIGDVTLLEVLSLHAKLAKNDGLENSGECHIVLKTRTNFSRRFSTLLAGAAEGKGLSHFAYWDDQSIGLDDSEDLGESKHDLNSNGADQEPAEATENFHEESQYEIAESGDPGQTLVAPADGQIDMQKPENKSASEQQLASPELTGSANDPLVMTPKTTALKSTKSEQGVESDIDEDGDLIDYSDDEGTKVEEKRKAAARNTDIDETATEEFEQRDELLHRRSLDRRQSSAAATPEEHDKVSEERALEQQQSNDEGEIISLADDGAVRLGDETQTVEKEIYTDQNEIGYEHFEVKDVDDNDYGDFAGNDLKCDHEETDHDTFTLSGVAKVGTENDESNATLEQYEGEFEHHDYAELDHDYEAEQGASHLSTTSDYDNNDLEFEVVGLPFQGEPEQGNDLLGLDEMNGHIDTLDTSKASSLDVVDTAESSVTIGADEIQYEVGMLEGTTVAEPNMSATFATSPGVAEIAEQKDEIDYEDDDEEIKRSLPAPTAALKAPGYQNVNGKRSIEDVESTDSQTTLANDAKRPRS